MKKMFNISNHYEKCTSKNINTCLELGESLLQRQHQSSEEITEKLQEEGDKGEVGGLLGAAEHVAGSVPALSVHLCG